ncbi:MAG: gamma-glutamyl kinase [Hasllibacter sp.]
MLVFFKHALVLLAVPKTGTTAYSEALADLATMRITDPPVLKHAPLYRYERFVRPMLEDVAGRKMETVAVIRDPVTWLGSWWRYRQRPGLPDPRNSTAGMTFDEFVEGYCRDDRPRWAQVGSQARFVAAKGGGIGVDRLFAYEAGARLDAFLSARLGRDVRTARRNVSAGAAPTLDPAVDALLRRDRAEEFDVWHAAGGR